MHSFNLPLSRTLDFGVYENAHAFKKIERELAELEK